MQVLDHQWLFIKKSFGWADREVEDGQSYQKRGTVNSNVIEPKSNKCVVKHEQKQY